jgi:hypothetical protein
VTANQGGAPWTVNPGTAANWGIGTSTQNSATVANGTLILGQFNTTPTTITSGNMSPLQMDSAGNLLVNIKAGAGSGGTAIADNAAFTQGTTSETPMGCLFTSSYTAATSGHSTIPQCDNNGTLWVNVKTATGLAAGSTTSGQTGSMIMGAVTTANPSYTTAQTNYVSLDTAGNVRASINQNNSSAAINISTATTTQLIALSGSTKIYVMAWDVIAGGTGNITLEYGTGSNCGTGTTVLTGAYNLTAQAGISKGDGSAPVLVVPAGNALCALTSAAVQMSGSVTFQQF